MDKELVPELRFEGFEEPWRQYALDKICKSLDTGKSVNSEDRAPSKGEISILKTSCVSEDYFNPKERKRVVPSEVSLVKCPATAGSIIVSRMNTPEKVGACGYVADNYPNLFLPDRLWRLTLEAGYDPYLLYTSLVSPSYRTVVKGMASGTSGSMHNVPQEAFLKMTLDTPDTKEEQAQIGDLFRDLDSLIAEQERKCAALGTARDALLDKMFPKEGETEPELRFDGFSGPWERVKLGELLSYEQPQAYIVSNSEYNDSHGIPVLTAGKTFILGYTVECFGVKQATKMKPVILFDDFTTACKYVDFPFKVKSSAAKILIPTTKCDCTYLVYESMNMINYEPLSHGRHWISMFSSFSINLPVSPFERQMLNFMLINIDENINGENQKLDLLKQLKGAMLDKMFPKGAR